MGDDLNEIQFAGFRVGETCYAVDIMRIREVIPPQPIAPLRFSSRLYDGFIAIRGSVAPVIDLRGRFSISGPEDYGPAVKFVVVACAGHLLALVVDDATGIITVPVNAIRQPADTNVAGMVDHLLGAVLADDILYLLLDIDSFPAVSP